MLSMAAFLYLIDRKNLFESTCLGLLNHLLVGRDVYLNAAVLCTSFGGVI